MKGSFLVFNKVEGCFLTPPIIVAVTAIHSLRQLGQQLGRMKQLTPSIWQRLALNDTIDVTFRVICDFNYVS